MIDLFGFNHHCAPGEAEAECAALQRAGVVDAVLSEDGDTLMFGATTVIRNWSSEGTARGNHGPTHINVYDAAELSRRCDLERAGYVAIAMMSGGDYDEGVKGIGIKLAIEVAQTELGKEMCTIRDAAALLRWRESLEQELRLNTQKLFSTKHAKLVIPADWPSLRTLRYYSIPVVSSEEEIRKLDQQFVWDRQLQLPELRAFVADMFEWNRKPGFRHFVRRLGPALVPYQLSRGAVSISIHAQKSGSCSDDQTDRPREIRISFTPCTVVGLPIQDEESDIELDHSSDSEAEEPAPEREDGLSTGQCSPKKRRMKPPFDPTAPQKIWVLETWVKRGMPDLLNTWYADQNLAEALAARRAAKNTVRKRAAPRVEPQKDAMYQFLRPMKPHAKKSLARVVVAEPKGGSSRQASPDGSAMQLCGSQPMPKLMALVSQPACTLLSQIPPSQSMATAAPLLSQRPSQIKTTFRQPFKATFKQPPISSSSSSSSSAPSRQNGIPTSPPRAAAKSQRPELRPWSDDSDDSDCMEVFTCTLRTHHPPPRAQSTPEPSLAPAPAIPNRTFAPEDVLAGEKVDLTRPSNGMSLAEKEREKEKQLSMRGSLKGAWAWCGSDWDSSPPPMTTSRSVAFAPQLKSVVLIDLTL